MTQVALGVQSALSGRCW